MVLGELEWNDGIPAVRRTPSGGGENNCFLFLTNPKVFGASTIFILPAIPWVAVESEVKRQKR